MRISQGNTISFAPDSSGKWQARFRDPSNNQDWTEPVIGWAVIVRWAGWEEKDYPSDDQQDLVETDIVPVVLDQQHVTTVAEYLRDRDGVTFAGLAAT